MAASVDADKNNAAVDVAAEVKSAPKRSIPCLQRLFVKNGGRRLTPADLSSLRTEIEAQTSKIRAGKELKMRDSNPREWWLTVRKLLLLKYDAALFSGDASSVSMKEAGDLFTEIKLRWRVKDADGSLKRLQRLVQCRTSLTATEILSIVTEFTASRFPQLGGPLAIAVRADLLDIALRFPKNSTDAKCVCPDPEAMRVLCADDVLTVPLEFPGPCLPNSTVIDLDVTFAAPPNNVTTPECYASAELKATLPELVDAGVNLCDQELCDHPLAVLHEAEAAGVSQSIAMSVDIETSRYNLLVARSAPRKAFAAVGVHPSCIPTDDKPEDAVKELGEMLEEDLKRPQGQRLIVAVGEIGLDFDKDSGIDHEVQKNWFDLQLQLACKYKMPVILHIRGADAFKQATAILRTRGVEWHGSVNCFDGTAEEMRELIDMGFYITWTGLLCNDGRAEALRSVVANGVPDKYLIGSDAPHLIPFNMEKPYPKCNRPCTLPHVVAMVANLLKMPVHQVASLTTANARAAFKLPTVLFNGSLPANRVAFDPNAFMEVPLVGEVKKKKAAEPTVKGKKGKKLRILNDEQIAALLQPGQKAFVLQGFVYVGTAGVIASLESLQTSNNPALEQTLQEFIAHNLITLAHDPNKRKKGRSHWKVEDRSVGRNVRRHVMHRHGGRHAGGHHAGGHHAGGHHRHAGRHHH